MDQKSIQSEINKYTAKQNLILSKKRETEAHMEKRIAEMRAEFQKILADLEAQFHKKDGVVMYLKTLLGDMKSKAVDPIIIASRNEVETLQKQISTPTQATSNASITAPSSAYPRATSANNASRAPTPASRAPTITSKAPMPASRATIPTTRTTIPASRTTIPASRATIPATSTATAILSGPASTSMMYKGMPTRCPSPPLSDFDSDTDDVIALMDWDPPISSDTVTQKARKTVARKQPAQLKKRTVQYPPSSKKGAKISKR